MNILLDYFFPVTAIEPTAQAATGFLKQVLVLVKPKSGVTGGTITLTTSQPGVAAITDNLDVAQLFAAGMTRVYVLAVDDLADVVTAFPGHESDFFTILVSSDFVAADVADLAVGTFTGVIGVSGTVTDAAFLEAQAAIKNRVAFHTTTANKAKNMFFAFGRLLSNASNWRNQQYIGMPFADDVDTLGEANNLFEDRVSFVLSDSQYGQRLGLFAAGGKAIVAPYIIRNLQIDMQSAGLTYVSGNQPAYTLKEASLMESQLQKVIQSYIERNLITAGTVGITLVDDNFVATGSINVAEPKALWRVEAEMLQTL